MLRLLPVRRYSIVKDIQRPTRSHPYLKLAMSRQSDASSDTGAATVLDSSVGHLKVVTLNRPSKLHSLDLAMIEPLTRHVQESQRQAGLSALLLKSSRPCPTAAAAGPARPAVFCSGGDIVQILRLVEAGKLSEVMEFFRKEYRLNALISHISAVAPRAGLKSSGGQRAACPVVACMDGLTMGGGFGLCMHTPWRICTERTKIAMPETLIGFIPDVGSTFFFSRLGGGLPLWLLLTGAEVRGSFARRLGLASHFIPSHRLDDVQERLAGLGPSARLGDILDEFSGTEEAESEELVPILPLIDRVFSADANLSEIKGRLETIVAGAAEYPKVAKDWAVSSLSSLDNACPLSLALTQRLLVLGRQSNSLEACLKNEYRVAIRLVRERDFQLGVTKRIVERQKDARPAWSPLDEDKVTSMLDPKEREHELPLAFDYAN